MMKRFDDYLIVTDLDGTLYQSQHNIPQVNIDAVNEFISLGGKFAVATGRGIEAARFITEAIRIPNPIIVNNGHTIYDFNRDEIVYNVYLPDRIKQFAKEVADRFPSVGIEIYFDRDIYVIRNNAVVAEHLDYEKVSRRCITFEEAEALPWSKLLFADEADRLALEMDDVNERLADAYAGDGFEVIQTSHHFLEGVCRAINKGTAVHELARRLSVPHNHVYTIGNFYNDIELVKCAHGAWVKDSPRELYDLAEYITDSTCADGAFAEYVRYVMAKRD